MGKHHHCKTLAVLAFAALFGLHGSEAFAEGVRSILVLPGAGGPDEVAEATAIAVRTSTELRAAGGIAVVPRSDAAQILGDRLGPDFRSESPTLPELVRQLERAEEQVFAEPGKAVPEVDRVVRSLMDAAGVVQDEAELEELLFRAHMLKSRALLDAGKSEEAALQMDEIVHVFGAEGSVTRAEFHPSIVDAYEAALSRKSQGTEGNLEVKTDVPGADIFVSGRKIELQSDALIPGKAPGRYVVKVRRGSVVTRGRIVTVPEKGTASVSFSPGFEDALRSHNGGIVVSSSRPLPDLTKTMREVADAMGVDAVLVVSNSGTGIANGILVYRNRERESVRGQGAQDDVSGNSAEGQLLQSLGLLGGTVPEATEGGLRTMDYVGIGLCAVGAGGLVLGTVKGIEYASKSSEVESSSPATKTLKQVEVLKDEAETAGLVSALSVGVGLAAVGAGVVLFFVGDDHGTANNGRKAAQGPTPLFFVDRASIEFGVSMGF